MSAAHSPRSFILIALAFLITMIGTTVPTPLYAIYQQHLGFDATWVTLIFAIYAAGVIAALLAVGSWSDQVGRRPMLIAGLAMGAISAVIFLTTDSVTGLLLGRLFSGFSAGIMTGTGTVAVIEAAPARWRGVSTLAATAANMLGLGLGPLLAGYTSGCWQPQHWRSLVLAKPPSVRPSPSWACCAPRFRQPCAVPSFPRPSPDWRGSA
jgi:MFS family permease